MVGHPYNGGALRLGATIGGESINWTDDNIYIAIMDSTYTQDVTHDHWDDISAHDIGATGTYVAGGVQLTTAAPYIESTLYAPYKYVVYTANAGETPAYSVSWSGVTFTDTSGAVIYKKGGTAATSPLLCFDTVSANSAAGDKYYILFGAIGATLGIYHQLLV